MEDQPTSTTRPEIGDDRRRRDQAGMRGRSGRGGLNHMFTQRESRDGSQIFPARASGSNARADYGTTSGGASNKTQIAPERATGAPNTRRAKVHKMCHFGALPGNFWGIFHMGICPNAPHGCAVVFRFGRRTPDASLPIGGVSQERVSGSRGTATPPDFPAATRP
jgi:hypothetical protein